MSIPAVTREWRLPKVEGIRSIVLTQSPVPAPSSAQVLVKIHAASIQFRDILVANGQFPLGQKVNPVLGSDMAGEIVAVGDDVKGWAVGDRVCANFTLDHIHGDVTPAIISTQLGGTVDGVLTEYKTFPAHSLVHIPAHLTYEEASTIPGVAVTAYNALMGATVPLKGGDVVLIQGTGGVAIFGLQIAVASGATVIVTSSSDEKLQVAKKLGAHHLINYKTTPDWEQEVLKITGGNGVDHILEVGGPATLIKSLISLRTGGNVNLIGFMAGPGDLSMFPGLILGKAARVRGILIGSVAQFENLAKLVSATKLKPVVDRVFPFEEVIPALEYLESQKHVGKVVIKVSKD